MKEMKRKVLIKKICVCRSKKNKKEMCVDNKMSVDEGCEWG